MAKEIIVSGIQPTGNLHIGNYLGAVKNWVDLQNTGRYEMYIFIADLHSLAGNMEASARREQIVITAAELLAAGIDPRKTTFFVQSDVDGHTELGWILNCLVPVAELERMTQFKDKSARQVKNINAGLLTYPVLQAADVLLYGAHKVPVGKDQVQHIELTRKIARYFNNRYRDYFVEPQDLLTKTHKIMSLLDPEKKMSKSLGAGHVIELADEPNVIAQKLKKAVTATDGGAEAPGVQNLFTLLENFGEAKEYKAFKKAQKEGNVRYGDLKMAVGEAISNYFEDFRKKRSKLLLDRDVIAEILARGKDIAQKKADKTLKEVKDLVGLV